MTTPDEIDLAAPCTTEWRTVDFRCERHSDGGHRCIRPDGLHVTQHVCACGAELDPLRGFKWAEPAPDPIDLAAGTRRRAIVAKVLQRQIMGATPKVCVDMAAEILLALDEDDAERPDYTAQSIRAAYPLPATTLTAAQEIRDRAFGHAVNVSYALNLTDLGAVGAATELGLLADAIAERIENGTPWASAGQFMDEAAEERTMLRRERAEIRALVMDLIGEKAEDGLGGTTPAQLRQIFAEETP